MEAWDSVSWLLIGVEVSVLRKDGRVCNDVGWTPWKSSRRQAHDWSDETKKGANTSEPVSCWPTIARVRNSEINKILPEKFKELANAAWTSPIVLAPKMDGSLHFCVDYRTLSTVNVRESYPISLKWTNTSTAWVMPGSFWTLAANADYWQIETDKDAKDETVFVTHHGLSRYKQMTFELRMPLRRFKMI